MRCWQSTHSRHITKHLPPSLRGWIVIDLRSIDKNDWARQDQKHGGTRCAGGAFQLDDLARVEQSLVDQRADPRACPGARACVGDVAGLFERFAQLRTKAKKRAGQGCDQRYPGGRARRGLDPPFTQRSDRKPCRRPRIDRDIARRRRARTDKIDGEALVRALLAYKQESHVSARWFAHQVSLRRTSAA